MPGGRPRKEISKADWEKLDQMAAIHCTGEEMAGVLGMSYDTLELRVKETHGVSFSDWFAEKSSSGKMSLRRKQFTMAQKNAAMAIWLGKQWLGQKDSQEIDQRQTIVHQIHYNKEDLNQAIEDAKKLKESGQ